MSPKIKRFKQFIKENLNNKVFLGYHSTNSNLKNDYYKGEVLDTSDYSDIIRSAYMEIISDYDVNLENDDIEAMNDVFEENGYGFTYVSAKPLKATPFQATEYKYGDNLYKVYGTGDEILLDDVYEINSTIVVSENPLYFERVNEEISESKNNQDNINDNFRNWFGDSEVVDDDGNPIVVYHATNKNFRVFNFSNSPQKLIWFTSDLNAIKNKEVGAVGYDYIKELYVSAKNVCGWKEYDKYGLGQLVDMGYDGCILKEKDGNFSGFVFNPNQIKSIDNDGSWDINDKNIYS